VPGSALCQIYSIIGPIERIHSWIPWKKKKSIYIRIWHHIY